MELDHPPFDAIVLGCGLSETIASASLAHAGKTVLHVDEESYYGSDYASLSLTELIDWAQARQTPAADEAGPSTYLRNQRRRHANLEWSYPASSSSSTNGPLPDDLKKASRGYSLSLAPLLIPSVSPLIDTLVASGVSRYSTFRLLESTSIYTPATAEGAVGEAQSVPGSKEDVFKDKTISLREKRSLMKVLLWIAGDFEGSAELAGAPPGESLLAFFERAFSLPASLAASLAYALAHTSSPSSEALPALVRMRSYLQAVGKYGNSPFLVAQYGGAGEVVQGFARLGAVQGAIYTLANPVESVAARSDDAESPIVLQIKGFSHRLYGKQLVAHPDYLPESLQGSSLVFAGKCDSRFARILAIFNVFPELVPLLPPGPVDFNADENGHDSREKQPDTALLVFPPGSLVADVQRTVQVVVMGEGTGSCPKDHYVVYLSTPLPAGDTTSAQGLLAPFLAALSPSRPPLFQLAYTASLPDLITEPSHPRVHAVRGPNSAEVSFTTQDGARCTAEGERLFWAVFGGGSSGKSTAETGSETAVGDDERGFFEPRAHFDDGDEWD